MTETTQAILDQLMQATTYLSGQQISETFGISRSAIWKHMNKLKAAGYDIESVPHKGYLLREFPEGFNSAEIMAGIHKDMLDQVYVYETIESTNDQAKELARHHLSDQLLVIAEQQTKGKGRRGRTWVSPKGTGIYVSLLLRPKISPMDAPKVTLVAGLALCQAIETLTGLDVGIKWPNDIVVGGKKVSGILTEMSAEMQAVHYIVLGIGVNVNTQTLPESIVDMATSLRMASGQPVDRKALLMTWLNLFQTLYETFLETGSLSFMMEAYNRSCVNIGKEVKVIGHQGEYTGIAETVLEDGGLVIHRFDGPSVVYSGEVSVRGLYGYV